MKAYADTKSRAKPSKIKIGDLVLACLFTVSHGKKERDDDYCLLEWQVDNT